MSELMTVYMNNGLVAELERSERSPVGVAGVLTETLTFNMTGGARSVPDGAQIRIPHTSILFVEWRNSE